MTRLLITGGSGFIGINLINSLCDKGIQLLNIDKLRPLVESHQKYWKNIDILDYMQFEAEVLRFDPEVVIHLAAVTDLNGKTLDYYKANIKGTENLIHICAKVKSLTKVIFTSSMYVCKPGYIPKDYDDYNPHTLYGESKVQGELLVKSIISPKYSWIIIRPTSIWGPWFKTPYLDFFDIVYRKMYYDFGRTSSKTYGYIENTVFQIDKLIRVEHLHKRTFYLGDFQPVCIAEWANEISIQMGRGRIKKVSFFLIKSAALFGDVLAYFKIKFPITSFRLSNMTTDNIIPLDDLFEITGEAPRSRYEGVKRTVEWIEKSRG